MKVLSLFNNTANSWLPISESPKDGSKVKLLICEPRKIFGVRYSVKREYTGAWALSGAFDIEGWLYKRADGEVYFNATDQVIAWKQLTKGSI